MDIKRLITSSEGRTLEFKREIPPRLAPVLRTIVAFSNGSGGDILIGIDDRHHVTGMEKDPLELEERLSSSVYDSISPMPGVFFQTHTVDNKLIFRIKVLPGPNKPYYLKAKGPEKGCYVRVGSTNRIADGAMLADLRRQAYNKSIDEELETRFECDILSTQVLSRYFAWRDLKIEAGLEYLEKEKLAVRLNGDCHPTVGGLLLFSDALPEPYTYAGFTVASYTGNDRSELRHVRTLNNGLLVLPETILESIASCLGSTVDIAHLRREQAIF